MANEKYLNLYTGNHGKQDGIEDYVTLITRLMSRHGVEVKVSSVYDPQAVNLVIDEFTNYAENRRIAAFKKAYPQSKIVFVLTEFAVRNWGVESFNHFGGPREAAAIALFDVYLRLIRDDFGRASAANIWWLTFYSPLLALQIVPDALRVALRKLFRRGGELNFLRKHHRTIYLHMRYLGLKACLQHADAAITSHERIIDGVSPAPDARPLQHFGVLYPEFDERAVLDRLMRGKKLFMEITGTISRYRQRWIERINQQLIALGMHNAFGYCAALSFSQPSPGKRIERGAYSLHPPQTRSWPYSSPTRIFRALAVDNNLPVLTHHFHQSPIEDVCFLLEGPQSMVELYEIFADPVRLKRFIEPRLKAYNEIVVARNDALVDRLRGLMETRGFAG